MTIIPLNLHFKNAIWVAHALPPTYRRVLLHLALLRLKFQLAEPGWLALPTRLLRLMLHAMLHLASSHLWLHCTIRSRDAVCAEHSGCQVPHVKGRRVSFSKDYVIAHLKIGI